MHFLIAVFFAALAAAFAIWVAARVISGRRPDRRFVVRTACGVGALLAAWVGIAELQWQYELRAIAMVERQGGAVVARSNAPDWLLRLRPDDELRAGTGIGPNQIRRFLPLDRLLKYSLVVRQVWLDNGNGFHPYSDYSGEYPKNVDMHEIIPTASDLALLNRCTQLQTLCLHETPVGDVEIAAIRDLRSLKDLNLADTNVTDASLEIIAGFSELERLHLDGTQITDAGLAKLANLKHLKELYVNSPGVTAAGLAPFHGRRGLKVNPYISN